MEPFGLQSVLVIVKEFGIPGLVLIMWFLSLKSQNKIMDSYRADTQKILADYKDDLRTVRQMYMDNVILVKNYRDLCGDLKDIVILNSKAFQALDDSIKRKCAALREG
jgi:hypothetical protein